MGFYLNKIQLRKYSQDFVHTTNIHKIINVCKIFTTLEKVERLSEEVEAVKGTIAGLETEIRSTIDGIKGEVQGVFDDAVATKAFAEEKFGSALADIQDATKNVDDLKSQFTEASKGIE